ncbi:nuclear hormone receptor HR96-like [Oppia nitens]|uniref:nuclear hormone receptor HR96-like n=1 Tax=Oppia nitens TaxID=1686743 RepID=UPI0023DB0BBC|nr:nuclear hormone receptor HR96-like [Oppia nitens]
MSRNKKDANCVICGDKATGNNFNAQTCESCKAFFRRNAYKGIKNCNFYGNCVVNLITRRKCGFCRLNKCFEMGMKKERIWTEETKEIHRTKVEINRLKMKNIFTQEDDCQLISSTTVSSSVSSPLSSLPSDQYNHSIDENLDSVLLSYELQNPYSFNMNDSNASNSSIDTVIDQSVLHKVVEMQTSMLSINGMSVSSLVDPVCGQTSLVSENIRSISAPIDSTTTISNDITSLRRYKTFNRANTITDTEEISGASNLTIGRPISDTRHTLTESEGNRFTHLLFAAQVMNNQLFESHFNCGVFTAKQCYRILDLTFEEDIRNLIQLYKQLKIYTNITESDSYTLVKSQSMAIHKLRMVNYVGTEYEWWNVKMMNDNVIKLNLNIYTSQQCYMAKFFSQLKHQIDNDSVIIDLLTTIVLYDPDTPGLINREAVKLQQLTYMYLLKRYLEIKYYDTYLSTGKFLRTLNMLVDLNKIANTIKTRIKARDDMPELVREVIDCKSG